MTSIQLTLTGAQATAQVEGLLTAGMVGIPVSITYDESWDGLVKTLVCKSDTQVRRIYHVESTATVAPEVLVTNVFLPGTLYLGVEGRDPEGNLVLPSTFAYCGVIQPGAQADCPDSVPPESSVWAQILAQMGDREALETENRDTLVAAINELARSKGGYYIPTVTQPRADTMEIAFTPSQGDMPAVVPQTVALPAYALTEGDKALLVEATLAALPEWEGGEY